MSKVFFKLTIPCACGSDELVEVCVDGQMVRIYCKECAIPREYGLAVSRCRAQRELQRFPYST